MLQYRQITPSEIPFPIFELKNKWMLITAGKDGKVNTMTASWGGFGIMWNKEVAFVVIRPQRYTLEFVEQSDSISLSFFDRSFKKTLNYLGSVSGRDENKIEKSNLTVSYKNGIPYFEEAETVIFAKKLFIQPMKEDGFIEKQVIKNWYPDKDYHHLYIIGISEIITKTV
ncbi:MAG: flavin reductase [Prevotellaceae bacterium]|nr:flavin reductase [Prevotellaceae bacterium]